MTMFPTNTLFLCLVVVSIVNVVVVVPVRGQLQQCTLCALGSDPVGDVTSDACSQILNRIGGLNQNTQECGDEQLAAYQVGCCESPPFEYCPVCPDGTPLDDITRLNEVPTGVNPADEPTCQEAQYRPDLLRGVFDGVEQGLCADTFLQRGGFYCGCPNTEQKCWMCPDKGLPGNGDKGDAFATNSRCRGLNYLFSVLNEEECTSIRDGFGVDHAAFCECGGLEERDETNPPPSFDCSFCEGGGQVVDPEFVYTDESDVFQRKCGQAQNFAQYVTTERACVSLFARARERCQCTGGNGGSGSTSISPTITTTTAAGTMAMLAGAVALVG